MNHQTIMHHTYHILLRLAFTLVVTVVMTGCKQHIDIQGTSSIPELEGRTLYLRVYRDGDLQTIDSASVTHGKFAFSGPEQDTTCMVFLFLEEQSVMPFVLERETPLTMTLDENENKVEGSALNDTLFAFIHRKAVLDEQLEALPRRESRMILDGYDHEEILQQLRQEAVILNAREDELVTRFIKDNMDNILAPGIFMVVTSNVPPMLTPQIEELITLASPQFLSDAYVQEFMRIARENMEKINE